MEIAVGKAFMWTFVGFCLGLAVVELTNGVPAEKVQYERYEIRYIYRPYPNYYYDRRVDTFNNQRPNSSGSSRSSRGSEPTRITPTVERGETHTGNVPQNDRKKN